jgi:hypothetical protein
MSRIPRRTALILAGLVLALTTPLGIVLANHTFTDVPTSHPFHADIAVVAASGVASGCSATRYCPDAYVTRGQMAAFLNRLGALSPEKPPVVNADELDGRDANELTRVAAMRTTVTSPGLPASPTYQFYGTPLSITAPTDGYVLVTGDVTVLNSGSTPCTANCSVAVWLGHTGDEVAYGYTETTIDPVGSSRAALGFSVLVPVSAGENFFDLRLTRFHGTTGVLHGWYASVAAIFSPFGPTGGGTSSLAALTLDEVTKDAP